MLHITRFTFSVAEEPGAYPIYDENVTQIALLISVTVCLTILIFTVAFVYLRSVQRRRHFFLLPPPKKLRRYVQRLVTSTIGQIVQRLRVYLAPGPLGAQGPIHTGAS